MGYRYELRAPHVICDDLDDEVIAIDLEIGRYYRLTGAARQVWAGVVAGLPTDAIAAACITGDSAGQPVDEFVDHLMSLNLVRPLAVDTAPAVAGPAVLDPWELSELGVEVFSDLEDILGLDPIHEVDPDVGWTLAAEG